MAAEHYYRVEETTYSAGVDEWGDALPGGPTRPNLLCFRVLKHTPTGVWLEAGETGRKFVSRNWVKQFACPTVEEAVASFKARKSRQVSIMYRRVKQTREALAYLEKRGFYQDGRQWMERETEV